MGPSVHCHVLIQKPISDLDLSRLNQGQQRYKWGLKMGPNAHWRVLLQEMISDLNPCDSVDAKIGVTYQDWTKDSRDTEY